MKKKDYQALRRKFLAKPVAELLGFLEHKDLSVRFFAEMALRDLAGT